MQSNQDANSEFQTADSEMKNYTVNSNPIGSGAYGSVYKGTNRITGEIVALKRTKIENFTDGIPSTTLREISILSELSHPNIVALKDVVTTETHIWFVQEYCNMDLSKLLSSLPP